MKELWFSCGEQLRPQGNPNHLALHPVPTAGTSHPTYQENISFSYFSLSSLPSMLHDNYVTIFYPARSSPLPHPLWSGLCHAAVAWLCRAPCHQLFIPVSSCTSLSCTIQRSRVFFCACLRLRAAAAPPFLLNHRSALSDGCSVSPGNTTAAGCSKCAARRLLWQSQDGLTLSSVELNTDDGQKF